MSRARMRLILLAAIVLSIATGSLQARGLPDWAEGIAETAPPPPEGVSKHAGRVLYSEEWVRVQDDASIRIRRRLAQQALSESSYKVGIGVFYLPETAKMTNNKVWHVPPGKGGRREMALPITVNVEDVFLGGTRFRGMEIDGIRKGSLVFFEFEAVDRPYFISLGHTFYEGLPVAVARYGLEAPEGWSVRHEWLRGFNQEPVREGSAFVWEMRDLPMPDDEPLAPDAMELAPMIAVNVVPPPGTKTVGATFSDWDAFGRWYSDLVGGREEPTEGIRKADVALGKDLDFAQAVQNAGTMVRDRVRYVAVELGIGGWQPRPAGETFDNLYGDCKDKGTLFRSFLSLRGITSYPVLVNLSQNDTVPDTVPYNGFNHFIVAVGVPAGVSVPPSFRAAMADAGTLGSLLMVDTTDDRVSIGSMSEGLSGKRALVIAGGKAQVITLPGTRDEDHVLHRTITAELMPDRSLSVRRASSYKGGFAAITRSDYRDSAVDRRRMIERRVVSIWPDATVQDYAVQPETTEGTFEETVAFALRPLPASGTAARVALFPGLDIDVERVPIAKRSTPVDYDFPRRIVYEVSYRGLPEDAPLPGPQDLSGEGWSLRSTAERRGSEVTGSLQIDLSRARYDADAFPDLRKLWSAVATAAARSVPIPVGSLP